MLRWRPPAGTTSGTAPMPRTWPAVCAATAVSTSASGWPGTGGLTQLPRSELLDWSGECGRVMLRLWAEDLWWTWSSIELTFDGCLSQVCRLACRCLGAARGLFDGVRTYRRRAGRPGGGGLSPEIPAVGPPNPWVNRPFCHHDSSSRSRSIAASSRALTSSSLPYGASATR